MAISTSSGMSVSVIPGKPIVKSAKVGAATNDEIKQLTQALLSHSAPFKNTGWVFISDISKAQPFTPDQTTELIAMTSAILKAGCKGIAFVQGSAFMTIAQAQHVQKQAHSTIKEAYFKTEAEAVKWAMTLV